MRVADVSPVEGAKVAGVNVRMVLFLEENFAQIDVLFRWRDVRHPPRWPPPAWRYP